MQAYDPAVLAARNGLFRGVKFCRGVYEAARGADCLAVMTEWNEFKDLDFARIKKLMRQPVIMDGRNIYNPEELKKLGFRYIGIGRGASA